MSSSTKSGGQSLTQTSTLSYDPRWDQPKTSKDNYCEVPTSIAVVRPRASGVVAKIQSNHSDKLSLLYVAYYKQVLMNLCSNCSMMKLVITSCSKVNEITASWSHYWESGDLRWVVSEFFDNGTKVGDCSFGSLLVIGQWRLDRHTWSLAMLTCWYSVNYVTRWTYKYHHWIVGTFSQELLVICDMYKFLAQKLH